MSRRRSGCAKQETGRPTRGGDGPVAFGAALDDAAVEEIEAVGAALPLDLPEQLLHKDSRIGRTAFAQVVVVGADQGEPVTGHPTQGPGFTGARVTLGWC
jgi:hypothetical protein